MTPFRRADGGWNGLLKNIEITRPDPTQAWATDITHLTMALVFLNLVPVILCDSPYVAAWRQYNTLEAGFCAEAMIEALARGRPNVFSTDQGSQFSGREFNISGAR